jgi:hypothetical protein
MGFHRRAATAALIALAVLAGALPAADLDAAPIEDADRRAIGPLEDFERRPEIPRARRALAAAREARDRLEAARVPDRLAAARREELAFLNHVVPGFEAWLAGPGGPGALATLQGILARGRRHRELSREALRLEARRRPSSKGS